MRIGSGECAVSHDLRRIVGGLPRKLPSDPSFVGAAGNNRHIGCLKHALSYAGRCRRRRKERLLLTCRMTNRQQCQMV